MLQRLLMWLLPLVVLAACQGSLPTTPTAELPPPEVTIIPRVSPTPEIISLTPTASPTATATTTPDPYADLRIASLAGRAYGGGELLVEGSLGENAAFKRYLISYPSDGLTIKGFMNVPVGEGPFAVALVLHGYIDPAVYTTLAYTTRYADALARAGYLVLHPNYRNYPPSDSGTNLFRVGYAVDVLNLIALVRQQGGTAGALEAANPEAIGLLGHSMGGGIALRTIVVDAEVDAAVLYGAMSGDERQNFEHILNVLSNGERGFEELTVPEEALLDISPIYHLARIEAAVSIHHGELDEVVPPAWSQDLCERLEALGKVVTCFTYANQAHTFYGAGEELFLERVVRFFDEHLGP